MSAQKGSFGQFKIGDWVEFQFGAQPAIGRIIEKRGPLGIRGQQLYAIGLDFGDNDKTRLELPEDKLSHAAEADTVAWHQHKRTTGIHQTFGYRGQEAETNGRTSPLYHYLVVAKPGTTPGSAFASVISLSEARAMGVAQRPSQDFHVEAGGPAAALECAEHFLDAQHTGLMKIIGPRRP